MSRCRTIHYQDDTYVELGPDPPADFQGYDYGSTIVAFWDRVAALGRRFGVGDLDRFVCPEPVYLEVDELEEELEEAEEEGEEERAEELRSTLRELLPAHDPAEVLAVVRGLIRHLEAPPDDFDAEVAKAVLVDLKGYRIALDRAVAAGRRVFITPF